MQEFFGDKDSTIQAALGRHERELSKDFGEALQRFGYGECLGEFRGTFCYAEDVVDRFQQLARACGL